MLAVTVGKGVFEPWALQMGLFSPAVLLFCRAWPTQV